jgi:hypothetical protein
VNAEKYKDNSAYPPTYFGSDKRDTAQRIDLKEAERRSGIDLVLPDPRTKATLILELRYEDGSLVTATGIPRNAEESARTPAISSIVATVVDLNGIQRGFADQNGPVPDGRVRLSLWTNETYIVKASRSEPELVDAPQGGVRIKFKTWQATSGPIRLTDVETTLRLVLARQPEP